MKKTLFLLTTVLTSLLLLNSCDKETFVINSTTADYDGPNGLIYSAVMNAREYAALQTGAPIVDTDGLIPTFEIVSGRKKDGTVLDATYMDAVTISNPSEIEKDLKPEDYYVFEGDSVKTYMATNYRNIGVIKIADENKFGIDDYYFTIKVSTIIDGVLTSNTFDDVFHLGVGPGLVTNLLYSPLAQNIVVGSGNTTTKPYLITGNPAVTFALKTETEKLTIDTQTGVISLKDGYSTVENDTIYPTVEVTSTISNETTVFHGDSFLMLVASNTPVILPKKTNYFFYPTLQAENKLYGYSKFVSKLGSVADNKVWIRSAASPLAAAERPDNVTGNKSLWTNLTVGTRKAHSSHVIINTQDLTQYKLGYDISTVFYTKNQYVEYMPDGTTPTDLEIYISTDYEGDHDAATWTKVNNQVSCQINSLTKTPFIGTPYPGDQKLKSGMVNSGQNTSRNADAKWVRCELNLNAYKDAKKFTLAFQINSYYTDEQYPNGIKGVGSSRPGRYYISDVHFKASEE